MAAGLALPLLYMLGELPIPQQINTLTTSSERKVLSTLGQSFQTNPGRCRKPLPTPTPSLHLPEKD